MAHSIPRKLRKAIEGNEEVLLMILVSMVGRSELGFNTVGLVRKTPLVKSQGYLCKATI